MAHFAELNQDNFVTRVIVVSNGDTQNENGIEIESIGAAFCKHLFGGNWIQTSYNSNFRKNYAGIGYTYDASRDAFISPKPFDSWILDEETCRWVAPVAYPNDGKFYTWDESTTNWKEIQK